MLQFMGVIFLLKFYKDYERILTLMENNIQVYIANGIDKTMLGFKLNGWCVGIAHETPAEQDKESEIGHQYWGKFNTALMYGAGFAADYYMDAENPYCLYVKKLTDSPFDIQSVISACRLFKLSKIGLYYPLSFNRAGGCILNALGSYAYENKNHIDGLENFSLTESEKAALQTFYPKLLSIHSESVKRMIELFHEAYRSTNSDIAFILRVTILEMLIEGNAELSYRLSRSVAVLLGKSREESAEIYTKCKELYSARSTYLHDGNARKITEQYRLLALDYSRRIIANLIDKDLKEVRNTLETCGFGDNPYHVDF